MAPKYIYGHVKLILTGILLEFVISTASTKPCTSKKTERDGYVIRNIGIKLCHLKCAEHGQCLSIEYDIETLTCHLLRDEMVEKKEEHVILEISHSLDPTDSCKCSFSQRCLKTRSGKEVCVQDSTHTKLNTVPPLTTQDSNPQDSTTEASEYLTLSGTDPPALVTTQNRDPQAAPSPADRSLYYASKDGDLEKVKRILAAGNVDINTRGPVNCTPVMEAAFFKHRDLVKFLVGRGADLSLVDRKGNNALHWAAVMGDLETAKLILSLVEMDINAKNNEGHTAADKAKIRGFQEVLDLLVSRGGHFSL